MGEEGKECRQGSGERKNYHHSLFLDPAPVNLQGVSRGKWGIIDAQWGLSCPLQAVITSDNLR